MILTCGHISETASLCVSGFVFSASDYAQELENGLTFYFCKLSNMTTNCSCSPTDYHNFTRFWFAYFKKPKVCSVPGVRRTIYFTCLRCSCPALKRGSSVRLLMDAVSQFSRDHHEPCTCSASLCVDVQHY